MTVVPNVFLSYRRHESSGYSRHMYECLTRELGGDHVFMDVDTIEPGMDWRARLCAGIDAAEVVLVLIGRQWLDLRDDRTGERRLSNPDDITRFEIAESFRRGKRVIPVLLEAAPLPPAAALPEDIATVAKLQAARLAHESFESDLQALLERVTGRRMREQLARERGLRRIVSWAPAVVFVTAIVLVGLATAGVLDFLSLETRIATHTLAAASLFREPPLASDLVLIAVVSGRERPGPEFRLRYAQLVDALASDEPRAILFDVRFQKSENAEGWDDILAASFQRAFANKIKTRVYFGFNELQRGKPLAAPALAAASTGLGLTCIGKRLGIANAVPVAVRGDTGTLPGLALFAAAPGSVPEFRAQDKIVIVPVDGPEPRRVALSYVESAVAAQTGCPAVARGAVRGYVLIEVPAANAWSAAGRRFTLDEVLKRRVPRGTFSGKTVLVGVETDEDLFSVARGLGTEQRFGYEIHALAASAIISDAVPLKLDLDSQGWLFLLLGAAGAVLGYMTWPLGRGPTVIILVLMGAAYLVVTVLVFARGGVLLNAGYDLVSLLCSFGLVRSLSRRWLPWKSRPEPGPNR
jgi:CHASE2 domain-containing sensor protein